MPGGGLRSRWGWLVAIGLLAMVAFALLEVRVPSRPVRGIDALAELGDRDDLNLIFLLVDTLRSDHLSTYGYARPTSPTLDELTSRGIRFAHVQSQSSWTKTSMASLWLGAYPVKTGVLRHDHAIPDAATLPAEILSDAGFRTIGIWRNGWVANNFGFAQGFDVYYRPQPSRNPERMQRGNPSAHPLMGSDLDSTAAALEFARTYRDERFFLYLHYMDVHQYVYDQNSALFGTDYAGAYDNAIHWTDRNVRSLLGGLDEMGLLEKSLVVLASDHGEAFYEHGGEGHGRNLYREVTETPLLIWPPFRLKGEVVVEERVQNVDIWPTLLELLGLPPLPEAQGRSLVPLIEAAAWDELAVSERLAYSHIDQHWGRVGQAPQPLVSVTRGSQRLFHHPGAEEKDELYDHADDPGEQTDLAASQPERVAELRALAQEYLATPPPSWGGPDEREIDELRLQQLRALGYALRRRGTSPTSPGSAP